MILRIRSWAERFRDSLFYLPMLFVVAAAALAQGMLELDERVAFDSTPSFLRFTVESARAVLSTVAGATITVTGVVFALTAVAVQLASSQFSPRVLRGFLRDRGQQISVGFMVATFTYALLVLRDVRMVDGAPADSAVPSLATGLAVLLGIAAIIVILGYVNRTAHSLQSSELIRRITDETCKLIRSRHPDPGEGATDVPPDEAGLGSGGVAVTAATTGWVQQISTSALLRAGGQGCVVRVDVRVGGFVHSGGRLATVWCEIPDGVADRVREGFVVGRQRTMQQDVAFGIRQLVDIALRALSPGVNDATTAYEVIVHLRAILHEILERDLPSAAIVDEEGRWLLLPHEYSYDEYIARSLDQIRIMVAPLPSLAIALLHAIAVLAAEAEAAGRSERAAPLLRQAELVVAGVEAQSQLVAGDVEGVRQAARDIPGVNVAA